MSSSTTSSSATASRLPSFEQRMQDVNLSKTHINIVVMDYLVREGYPKAAQKFAMEANIRSDANLDSIEERVEIRNLIFAGDIEAAKTKINELNPQILDCDESLLFALLRLQLVELIRKCMSDSFSEIGPALDFATEYLAPRAPTNSDFLRDFEQTMTLLIFDPKNLTPEMAALLDPNLRKEVALRVNEAILRSQGQRTRSKLLELVKSRAWAERTARELKKPVPDELDIGLDPERGATAGAASRESSAIVGAAGFQHDPVTGARNAQRDVYLNDTGLSAWLEMARNVRRADAGD